MRIRSTKPEFWRSRTVASVSWEARLVLKGLESYVDDNGVGKDDTALIVGDVFPRDMLANPRETVARVSEAISMLSRAGLIWRYEVDGTPLLYISNWENIQRIDKPGKGRLPRPDGTMDFRESIIRESVANPRESVAPGTGEQGNRGTGEQGKNYSPSPAPRPTTNTSTYPDAFEAFWDHYPRKSDKRSALKAWQRAVKRASNDELIAGAIRYRNDPNREDQYTKHGATWLNADGWLDEPLPARGSTPKRRELTTRERRHIEAELLKENPDPRLVRVAQEAGLISGPGPDRAAAADRGGIRQPEHRLDNVVGMVESGGTWALEA